MGSYEGTISVLEAELAAVERVFAGLSSDEWRLPTKLVPVDPALPHWTVFELAGHFDISIGLARMLIAGADASQPARDRTSFFINPRSETAPVVYSYAYQMVEGKTPADMPGVLHETFSTTVAEARAVPAGTVGPGYFASRSSRIAATAAILDDLLARRTIPGRPSELSNDLQWVLAASGRAQSGDNRLPLIG